MTVHPFRVARSILPIGLAGLALAAHVGTAKAEVNDGLFGALSRLFAPPPEPRYYAPPAFVPRVQISRPRRSISVRHASLPRASQEKRGGAIGKPQADKTGKVVVREPNGDAVASALSDPTLRRGDIVVLPGTEPPRCSKAGRQRRTSCSDWTSRAIRSCSATRRRRDLMAMRTQPGANGARAGGEHLGWTALRSGRDNDSALAVAVYPQNQPKQRWSIPAPAQSASPLDSPTVIAARPHAELVSSIIRRSLPEAEF